MKKLFAIGLLIILAGIAIWQTSYNEEAKIGLDKGNQAPDFELVTLDGESKKLSDYQGKKVILNFWATWCPPCQEEMPEMEKFHQQYGDEVYVIAVNFTVSESNEDKVKKFIVDHEYSFPVLLDPENKANSGYEVLTYPTSYFIDENGIIRNKVVGPMTLQVMKEKIEDM